VILVDSNVIIDVIGNDPQWADWSITQLRQQSQVHELAINPIVYAELSLSFKNVEQLDKVINSMQIIFVELPRAALFLAAHAFAAYKARGGAKLNVLPDFFIGAHAVAAGCALLTRDTQRYRTYFPRVPLIAPL
jgi:predicted nucleic acid-binding protein